MGGLGSGRDGYRPVVEYGLKLDSYRLQRQGLLSSHSNGIILVSLKWTNTVTGEEVASINYEVDYFTQCMKLSYTRTLSSEKYPINDIVWLTTQKTNFNGSRFLFLCPKCSRRTAKLYLPNGALHFRCRICYNLTYLSSNESHRFDSMFFMLSKSSGLSVLQVKRALKNQF
ncbi:MAG: hypothetical protein PHP42_09560 [Bacteroidota bacterium]|nr:hypothetical protein [Bacteroidota bacterium]